MTRARSSSNNSRATIADVARQAGVSRATVSFVLNNTPGQTISSDTRQRVLAACEALEYRPNASARALGKGHSDEIAHLSVEPVHSYAMLEWLSTIQERTQELGYTPGTYLYYGNAADAMEATFENVLARRPVGIISSTLALSEAHCIAAARAGVRACVVLSNHPVGYAPTVTLPYEEAGYLVGVHFAALGHRRIAYVRPTAATPLRAKVADDGAAGIRRASAGTDFTICEIAMRPTLAGARHCVEAIMSLPERPTAVWGFTDDYCLPLHKAFLELGVRMPDDIALVGTEDTYLSTLLHPTLTCVRFDVRTLGYHLVDIVDALAREREPAAELFSSPPPRLIVRDSG